MPKIKRVQYRVLLIEDHPPLAEAMADFMQTYGLEVRIASTGKEALRMVSAFRPQIVLCDVNLPDMPGPDLAQSLRATPGAKDALIVIHTAMSERDLTQCRAINAPVNMFLPKPLTEEKLCGLLSELEARAKQKVDM